MADELERRHARRAVLGRLQGVGLAGGDSHAMLSAIGRAVLDDTGAWTQSRCDLLRSKLVWLLDDGAGVREGDELAEMWAEGMSVKAIARRTGRTEASVYGEIRCDRTRFPPRKPRASRETRESVTRMVADGELTVSEAAELADVDPCTVRRWVKRGVGA